MGTDASGDFGNDADAAEQAVALLKSLSHVGRLRILCALLDRPLSVSDLCAEVHEPQSSVSQHLMRLRAAGLVARRRTGRTVEYRLHRAEVRETIASLRRAFCSPGTLRAADTGQGPPA